MISQPCVSGRSSPGMIKVLDTRGSPRPGQDRLSNHVIRNANPDRTPPGMQHSSGNLAGCRHDEGVLPGRRRLDGAKDHVVELYEPAKLSEVGADEREVMPVVQLTDLSNPLQARPVVKLAAKREAGVGWVGDQAVSSQQVDHSANRSRLRVVRVDIEVSGHEIERSGMATQSVARSEQQLPSDVRVSCRRCAIQRP